MNDLEFTRVMRQLAEQVGSGTPPGAAAVWTRAVIRERIAANERAARVVWMTEVGAAAALLVTAVLILPWRL
jgi:hypothetical protein